MFSGIGGRPTGIKVGSPLAWAAPARMREVAAAAALYGTGWVRALGCEHDIDGGVLVGEEAILGCDRRNIWRSGAGELDG
jgi:hypothetical protein